MAEDDAGSGGTGIERRQHERDNVVVRVRFRSIEDLVARYTSDVSKGGLFVSTPKVQPAGSLVSLALDLADGGTPAVLEARVAYVVDAERAERLGRSPGMGLAFVGDTSIVGERIAAYLAAQAGAEESEPAKPLHVLVVDDSPTYRASIEEAMRRAGHRVSTADHGLAAVGAALREPPDIVLSDVQMPMMDGWQLVRVLRSRPATRAIPVIFLTTLASERDRIRGYSVGVADYVEKPFDPHVLAARVASVARRAASERVVDADSSGLRGDIDRVSIASLLAFLESERRSGVVVITLPSGEVHRIHVHSGLVTQVTLAGAAPASMQERLFRTLDLMVGRFEVTELPAGAPADASSAISVQHALLEHARRADEQGR